MQIVDNLLNINTYSRPGIKLTAIKGVVIHYVGNPNTTALANRNYFNNLPTSNAAAIKKGESPVYASSHYIVGLTGEVIRCVPDDELAYHAGKSYGTQWNTTNNNKTLLGIETCHPDSAGKFNEVTYKSLVELTAYLCNTYNLDVDTQVHRHYDVCGKSCPLWYVKNPDDWYKLKEDVKQLLNESKEVEEVKYYNTVEEIEKAGIATDAVETVKLLIDNNIFADKANLRLSEDMLRLIILNNRAGLYNNLKK